MSDCNGSPCRDWVITLAQDGTITAWGWVAIVLLTVAASAVTMFAVLLWDVCYGDEL